MARAPAIALVACLFAVDASAYIPFAHEGWGVVEVGGERADTRVVFSSALSATNSSAGILVRATVFLPNGHEGFLTIDMTLAGIGNEAKASWHYYEQVAKNVVSFEAVGIDGKVVVIDRFEAGGETSLELEISATLSDASGTKEIAPSRLVTTPAPWVLRGEQLPEGVVVMDDGSDAIHFGAGYGVVHEPGIDCTGSTHDEVVIEDDDDDWWDYDDSDDSDTLEIIEYEDDDDSWWEGDDEDDGWFSADDDTGIDCSGPDDSSSSISYDESSDSGLDCDPDTVEASAFGARPRFSRAPTDRGRWAMHAMSRRILNLAPMLLLLLGLLVARERA